MQSLFDFDDTPAVAPQAQPRRQATARRAPVQAALPAAVPARPEPVAQAVAALLFDESAAGAPTPTGFVQANGTWAGEEATLAEIAQQLDVADAVLGRVRGAGWEVFARAIDEARACLVETLRHHGDNGRPRRKLWGQSADITMDELAAVVALAESSTPAVQGKVRRGIRATHVALHIPGGGSIEVQSWPCGEPAEPSAWVSWRPGRSPLLLASHHDEAPILEESALLWGNANQCGQISMAQGKAPSVKPVLLRGRQYVVDGTVFSSQYMEGTAWALVPRSQWRGPTYTREELLEHWNAGRLERGDQRGLVVLVRGVECVFSQAATLYDSQAGYARQTALAQMDRGNDAGDAQDGPDDDADACGQTEGDDPEGADFSAPWEQSGEAVRQAA